MKQPSLRDVAALAQTSTAVASYVVNNGPRPVAPATRRRVEEAIATLGYRPNALARGLRTQQTMTIGLVVPDLIKPFFAETAAALENAAAERGYRLLVSSSRFDKARENDQVGALIDARVDGVVIAPADTTMPASDLLAAARIPTVIAYREPDGFPMPKGAHWSPTFVSTDDVAAGAAAAQHLTGHGWRRLACLAGPLDQTPVGRRSLGFAAAVRGHGKLPPPTHVECDFSDLAASAYRSTLDVLAGNPDTDGICATTDDHALGAIRAIDETGRTLGRDIGLVGIGGSALTDFLTPPLTVLQIPVMQFGWQCMETLKGLMDGEEVPPPRPLELALIARGTCGC